MPSQPPLPSTALHCAVIVYLGVVVSYSFGRQYRDDMVSSKIEDKDKRVASMNIIKEKETIAIECLNYHDGNLNIENGSLGTTKKDKTYHGLGIESIKRVCDKYDAILDMSHNESTFKTIVSVNASR